MTRAHRLEYLRRGFPLKSDAELNAILDLQDERDHAYRQAMECLSPVERALVVALRIAVSDAASNPALCAPRDDSPEALLKDLLRDSFLDETDVRSRLILRLRQQGRYS